MAPAARVNHRREARIRAPGPAVALALSLSFAAAVAIAFRVAWNPPAGFYAYNVPIAVPFAAFFLDRWSSLLRGGAHEVASARGQRQALAIDAAILILALLRVAAPPLPFASGHTLFAAYAAATSQSWVLRATAALVLAHVVYLKVFVTGGFWSMAAGLAIAAAATLLRRHLTRPTS